MRSPDASRSPRQRLDHVLSGHPPDPDPPPDDEVDAWVVEDDDPPPRTPPSRPRRRVSRGAAFAATLIALFALVVAVPRVLSRGPDPQQLPQRPQPSVLASAAGENARVLSVSMPPTPSSSSAVLVHVVGQVRRPGLVRLGSGARVADALRKAGGTTRRADLSALNLARLVADGEQVFVPAPGQAPPSSAARGPTTAPSAGAGSPVDLNAATESELDALPGVGPVIAGRIVAWRQEHGRFASVEELTEVSGIGDATLERLRPLVRT